MANCEKAFPILILIFGLFVYYWLVFSTYIKSFNNDALSIVYLTLFHFSFFLLVWSFITTMVIKPGKPPVFWVC